MTSTTFIDNQHTSSSQEEDAYIDQLARTDKGGSETGGGSPQLTATLTVGHTLTPQQFAVATEALSTIPGNYDLPTVAEALNTLAILVARSREKGYGPAVTCTTEFDSKVYDLLELAGRYHLSDELHAVAAMYDILLRHDLGEDGIWSFQHYKDGMRYLVVQINRGRPDS